MLDNDYLIVLENVRSAYNVGSVARTLDALGSSFGLLLVGITPRLDHPKVRKTSLGAEASVRWERLATWDQAAEALHRAGYTIYAVEAVPEAQSYTAVGYPRHTALVFGNEVRGVTMPVVDSAKTVVNIPMKGHKTSLNVATSVGVVAFEINRQING